MTDEQLALEAERDNLKRALTNVAELAFDLGVGVEYEDYRATVVAAVQNDAGGYCNIGFLIGDKINRLEAERNQLRAELRDSQGSLRAVCCERDFLDKETKRLFADWEVVSKARDQLLADLRAIAAAITEPTTDLPSKYLEVKIAGPILDLVQKYRGKQ